MALSAMDSKKRILVVDDEANFSLMLKLSLEKTGKYEVLEVNDPTTAMKAAHQFRPDLILMDIMMPHIDGSELAATLQADEELRGVPVVFLTALVSTQETHIGSFVRGGRTFLPKPVEWGKLIECIEQKTAPPPEPGLRYPLR